ncbi:MAG TPA: DUF177 domain-containing protein [Defluviitoga sp.]|nr:DUF177 domain-containing protein [Defluviitoga sp.]HOP24322.1 DUF177 domain-containing protein [Defluviitoga sp.]HPZ28086.1 DUF177 domain-containing protein [Defluviitoga sp.]HQD61976.1 DUF177 domain-containing protein [Defluviitoga sp.]
MFNEELKSSQLVIEYEKFEKIFERRVIIRNWKEIELPSENSRILSPIDVFFLLEKRDNQVYVSGKVETLLQLHCSRCLKPIEYWVEENFDCIYIDRRYERFLSKTKQLKSLENIIYYDNSLIDLTNRVIEAIILAVPEIPLCKEDCKGLCQICGADLNENPNHTCETEEIDPRLLPLKNLLEK